MSDSDVIVGIDLGTTNSAVATFQNGKPVLIPLGEKGSILPSVVGFSPDGELLVGHPARNQYALYPERTVRSIKRRMGEDESVSLGDEALSPVEISSLILRRLKDAAQSYLKRPVERAVITVPAYFSDAQRTATRQAGELAGLKVERIINEPTAAALCYVDVDEPEERHLLVYDLGGGTFDVSIVRTRGAVTEVLASHGDTQLGGDDMDQRLVDELRRHFEHTHDLSLEGNTRALARLQHAAEEAKIRLSTEAYAHVTEEHLVTRDGVGLHLDMEISRREYETLIEDLVTRTMQSIHKSLQDADLSPAQLDDIILVGGATRTPLVQRTLFEYSHKMPRVDVNPDEAVAMGAAIQAARQAGTQTGRVLVDVTPFSFGTSHLGMLRGHFTANCYTVIVPRNTPLPARQAEIFYTSAPGQRAVDVRVFQGEEEDALENLLIGNFRVENLDGRAPQGSPIVFEMRLGLDGILEVEVTERHTGLKKAVTIEDAFRRLSPEELAAARRRLAELYGEEEDVEWEEFDEDLVDVPPEDESIAHIEPPEDWDETGRADWRHALALLIGARDVLPTIAEADREELDSLCDELRKVMTAEDATRLKELSSELEDILFYLE